MGTQVTLLVLSSLEMKAKKTNAIQEIYDIVQKAHDTAILAVKPGMKASEIDKIARDIIQEAGYGEYFIHRLGHGIGQSVHEFPSIMEGNDMELVEGMCFSVEPGVYISGDYGVRIEDCLAVTKDGAKLFTSVKIRLLMNKRKSLGKFPRLSLFINEIKLLL